MLLLIAQTRAATARERGGLVLLASPPPVEYQEIVLREWSA